MSRADGGGSTGGYGPPSDTAETHTDADLLEESSGDSWTHPGSPALEDLPVLQTQTRICYIAKVPLWGPDALWDFKKESITYA